MLVGYARVSTADQNPDHQVDALKRAGVAPENIYIDFASGSKASRPKWDIANKVLRRDDTLVCTRLDRLSRSLVHLVNLGADFKKREVGLKVLE